MRADMFKIIVERPRLRYGRRPGSRYARGHLKGLFARDPELAPLRQSMKFATKRRKWLNENLAPLARFLESRVGKRWNDVYSEISARIDRKSAVQKHVLEHLDDLLMRDVESVDGQLVVLRYGKLVPIAEEARRRTLYVCPRTGIVRRIKATTPRAT